MGRRVRTFHQPTRFVVATARLLPEGETAALEASVPIRHVAIWRLVRMLYTRIVPSDPPAATRRPSGEIATAFTGLLARWSTAIWRLLMRSQMRSVPSSPTLTAVRPDAATP